MLQMKNSSLVRMSKCLYKQEAYVEDALSS